MYLTRNKQGKYVMARVMRGTKLYSKYFTLKDYKTWRDAEIAGRRWIRELLPTLPSKMTSEGRMTIRNQSGEVGVHRSPGRVKKPNGRVYECPRWIARWAGCPLRGGLSWSVLQWDEDNAYVLAVIARRRRSVNRPALIKELLLILGKTQYKEILDAKRLFTI
jgi:hypothetical protein